MVSFCPIDNSLQGVAGVRQIIPRSHACAIDGKPKTKSVPGISQLTQITEGIIMYIHVVFKMFPRKKLTGNKIKHQIWILLDTISIW